jgi:polysaccharide biosynthesis/export protein
MYKSVLKYFFVGIIGLLYISCSQQKNVAYYQNIDQLKNVTSSNTFESKIQPDDLLIINVSAPDPEAAAPFNLETTITAPVTGQYSQGQRQQQLYLVDSDGLVNFPVLGEINVVGLTKKEFTSLLKSKLKKYIKDAIVNVRIMNFKITVQGEVTRPGSFNVPSERITLPEALSLAGDLTIYGKRNNIILIREESGKKSFNRIDITKSDFINSPFYYLSQNDLIYVEPNNAKSNTSSVFNQNIPVFISLASLISSAIFSILLIQKN